MTDPEAHLAAALRTICPWHDPGDECPTMGTHDDEAQALLAALADDGYTIVSQMEWMDRADPTLDADLALAAAVRRLPKNIRIEMQRGEDYWYVSLLGVRIGPQAFANREGHGPTLIAAIEEALRDD